MTWNHDLFERAWDFAARAHRDQKVPGTDLPYLVHLVKVVGEVVAASTVESFGVSFAVTCALLHDTVEDTNTRPEDLEREFGPAVAAGVAALSKPKTLPKTGAMADSLRRIHEQPREVALVKLADRIANLDGFPPTWTLPKRETYVAEADLILRELGAASPFLADRLRSRIATYRTLIEVAHRQCAM